MTALMRTRALSPTSFATSSSTARISTWSQPSGPIPMMKAVADMTRKAHIRTIVSLNPIMIDGTGMCGGCRVLVDSKSEFACVDGPDSMLIVSNFTFSMQRNSTYQGLRGNVHGRFRTRSNDASACTQPVPNCRPVQPSKEGSDEHSRKTPRRTLPLRDRMKIPRQHMLEQAPELRATNFTEVNLGYSTELAQQEALRCLECAKPTCTDTCPVRRETSRTSSLLSSPAIFWRRRQNS